MSPAERPPLRAPRRPALALLAIALAAGLSACGAGNGGGSDAKISGTTLTVYASVPPGADGGAGPVGNGAKVAIQESGGRVGKYTIVFKPLADRLLPTGQVDANAAEADARRAADEKSAVAYVGDQDSAASKRTIPILNKEGVAQVSPGATYGGLTTRAVPPVAAGEPGKYYPTGKRNFARIVPLDPVQAAALALTLKSDGCKGATIWHSGSPTSASLARMVQGAAARAGVKVDGLTAYDPRAPSYGSRAKSVKSPCFVSTGEPALNGGRVLADAAAALPKAKLYASDEECRALAVDASKAIPASAAGRLACTSPMLDAKGLGLKGKAFATAYSKLFGTSAPTPQALYGYETMALVLDAVRRASGGGKDDVSRDDVANALFEVRNRRSVLGTYGIDREGDTSLTAYGLYKVAGRALAFAKVVQTAPLLPKGAKAAATG